MDEKTINQLAELIYENWNKISHKGSIKRKINSLFHQKKSSNVIKDYKDFLAIVPKERKKSIPIMTVILVLALCRRNLDDKDRIYETLKQNRLIPPLYGGMSILLSGNSKQLAIKLKWQDGSFKNKYEFIKRFQGEFLYWDYIELFMVANIIKRDSQRLFEELVLKDKTHLLLLNLASGYFDGEASEYLITTLISDKSELCQNAGFFMLTSKLNRYMGEVIQYKREKELGVNVSHRKIREINSKINNELNRIENLLAQCSGNTRTSLIINYLLSETSIFPKAFGALLLDPKLKDYFIHEVKDTNKVNTIDKVYYILNVVSNTRIKNRPSGYSKLELYNVIIDVIISFIRDRKGIYQWTNTEKNIMRKICKLLPQKPKHRLLNFLIKESEDILCLGLDELIRFDIFLKDKSKENIIKGMLSVLNNTTGNDMEHHIVTN